MGCLSPWGCEGTWRTRDCVGDGWMVTTDSGEEKGREITGVYPQSLQDPRMGGSRLAKMADEEEELGTSGHEVEHCAPDKSRTKSRCGERVKEEKGPPPLPLELELCPSQDLGDGFDGAASPI